MKRKLLSVLMVTVMLFTCIPLGAVSVSAEELTQGVYTYTVTDGEATITQYNGTGGVVVIPATIEGYPVTAIGEMAFINNSYITSVRFPDSVTVIGEVAFQGCSSLASVEWPDGLTTIDDYAFLGCAFTWLVIPDSVTHLGIGAFDMCDKLVTLTVGDGIETIPYLAFEMCTSLTSVTLPKDLKALGSLCFADCVSLEFIEIPEGVTEIIGGAFYGCEKLQSIVLPKSITYIGTTPMPFTGCENLHHVYYGGSEEDKSNIKFSELDGEDLTLLNATWHYNSGVENGLLYEIVAGEVTITGYTDDVPSDLVIPDTIEGYPVTEIRNSAFWGCTILEHVTIPDSVVRLDGDLFMDCENLESVILGKGLTSLSFCMFLGCTSLTTVHISEGVTLIMMDAFYGCTNLKEISLPSSVDTISYSFGKCDSLTTVYYSGTQEDWLNVDIDIGYNASLINATWHYNCINPKDHYSANVQHSVMDTEKGNGLAFKFELTASVGVKGKNKMDFKDATINYLGKTCKLVGMGTVITNQEGVTPALDNVNGKTVIDVPTVYLTDWEPDSCAFATRIINIPEHVLDRTIYIRPYYIVEVDSEQIVVYGDMDSASCAEYM